MKSKMNQKKIVARDNAIADKHTFKFFFNCLFKADLRLRIVFIKYFIQFI